MPQPPPPFGFNAFTTDDANTPAPYALNSTVMVGAIILLFLVICFILIVHVYTKWFMQPSPQPHVIRRSIIFSSFQRPAAPAQNNTGLDKATIAQLPTFVYKATSPLDSLEAGESSCTRSSLECVVCLSEFQENEKGRILPACKHAFHTECIDRWFLSHSTCPLCRANAAPAMATSAETTSTDQRHGTQEAMERSSGTTEDDSVTLDTLEYRCNVASQDASTASLPMSSSSSLTPGASAVPQITIEIPPAEGRLVLSSSERLSAKCTLTEQEAGSSQPPKSPGLRASIKRMLSRQSSGHKSSSQDSNFEESHK